MRRRAKSFWLGKRLNRNISGVIAYGNQPAVAGDNTLSIPGLTVSTPYRLQALIMDAAGNISEKILRDFTTRDTPLVSPTYLRLTADSDGSFDEKNAIGATVATFEADGDPAPEITITGGADSAKFTMLAGAAQLQEMADYERQPSYELTLTASNGGVPITETFILYVNDLFEEVTEGMTVGTTRAVGATWSDDNMDAAQAVTLEFEATFSADSNALIFEKGNTSVGGPKAWTENNKLWLRMGEGSALNDTSQACFTNIDLEGVLIGQRHKYTIVFHAGKLKMALYINDILVREHTNGYFEGFSTGYGCGYGGVAAGSTQPAGGNSPTGLTGATLHTDVSVYYTHPNVFTLP